MASAGREQGREEFSLVLVCSFGISGWETNVLGWAWHLQTSKMRFIGLTPEAKYTSFQERRVFDEIVRTFFFLRRPLSMNDDALPWALSQLMEGLTGTGTWPDFENAWLLPTAHMRVVRKVLVLRYEGEDLVVLASTSAKVPQRVFCEVFVQGWLATTGMMNHVLSRQRVLPREYVAATVTPGRNQLVGVLRFSGQVERSLPAGFSRVLDARSAKALRKDGPPRQFPDMCGQRVPYCAPCELELRIAAVFTSRLAFVLLSVATLEMGLSC